MIAATEHGLQGASRVGFILKGIDVYKMLKR